MKISEFANKDEQTLAALEAQVKELEESLSKTRASAVALRARVLAEGLARGKCLDEPAATDSLSRTYALSFAKEFDGKPITQQPQEKQSTPLPRVTLAALPPQHILRIKWHLEDDFPLPGEAGQTEQAESERASAKREGHLRLFGLLNDGSPWECSILYSNLMDGCGITLGREATDADIVLNDPSISRCHLRLELTEDGVVVSDEHSTNGTRVNTRILDAYNRYNPLNDGDILSVAEIDLKVELL